MELGGGWDGCSGLTLTSHWTASILCLHTMTIQQGGQRQTDPNQEVMKHEADLKMRQREGERKKVRERGREREAKKKREVLGGMACLLVPGR